MQLHAACFVEALSFSFAAIYVYSQRSPTSCRNKWCWRVHPHTTDCRWDIFQAKQTEICSLGYPVLQSTEKCISWMYRRSQSWDDFHQTYRQTLFEICSWYNAGAYHQQNCHFAHERHCRVSSIWKRHSSMVHSPASANSCSLRNEKAHEKQSKSRSQWCS